MTSARIPDGDNPVGTSFDTSWLPETSDPSGDDRARGRGGRRRARRRTLSPSIGSKSFMSGVDFDDPENFPNIPVAGASSPTLPVKNGASVVSVTAEKDRNAALIISPTKKTTPSPSPGSDEQDDQLPDPSVVADLFDEEGTPEAKLPSPPLGLLGSLGNQACSVGTEQDRSGKKGRGQGQGSVKSVKGSSREDAHTSAGVENCQPGLDRPAVAAPGITGAVFVTSSTRPVLTSTNRGAPSSTTAKASPAMNTTVTPGGGKGEEEGARPPTPAPESTSAAAPPAPPAAAKLKKSRNARRRSILMPSEAFAASDLAGSSVEVAPPPPRQNCSTVGDNGARPTAATTTDREGKPKRSSGKNGGGGGGGSGKTAAEEFPLTSINATSCLAVPLATQRGWRRGSGDSTKSLVRAYYAVGKGSQRGRRIAARLFCLTGFCLSPVTADDARVLCQAAGDTMEWGLEETDKPRLVTRALVRETREQKRELVLRIKPLFELMDNATQDQKRAAEEKTGVVSRKAVDGYCYEDRETKMPVDPDVYKAVYTKHIQATRAARLREFALLRANTSALPEVAAESSSGSGKNNAPAASASPPALPAGAAQPTPENAAALSPQLLPVEPERIETARTLEATKTEKGRDGHEGAVTSAGKLPPEGRLATAVSGASDQHAHLREETEANAVGTVVAIEGMGADGVRTPGAATPSKVGLEGSVGGKGFATPSVAGGDGEVTGKEEANREVKTPAAAQSPVGEGVGAAVAEGFERCGGVGGDPLVVAGTVGNAESLSSSAAGGSGLDSPMVDSDATAHAPPAHSPLDLELSGIETVEANVSIAASVQEDGGHHPNPESSGVSGTDHAVRSLSPSSPFPKEPTASPPPPKTAAAPNTTSPERAPLAFPARFDEDDNEESSCQVAGRRDEAQVLPSAEGFATLGVSCVCDTESSEATLSPGVAAEEVKELAALQERLWNDWYALLERYNAGVALIKSRRNCRGVLSPVTSVPAHEKNPTAVFGAVDAVAPPAATPNAAMMVATRLVSEVQQDTPASSRVRTVASPANNGSAVEADAFSRGGGEASPSPTPQPPSTGRAGYVDVPTPLPPSAGRAGYASVLSPSSLPLPLLDLRLSEEEEDLFESRSLRTVVEGTRAARAISRSTRRRSPAQQFSAEKRSSAVKQQRKRQGGVVGSAGGAGGVAVGEGVEEDEGEEGGTCRLCCRKECDRILRPCQHAVCGKCVEKLRVQAEQSGEVLSCPWDRQPVDEIDVSPLL